MQVLFCPYFCVFKGVLAFFLMQLNNVFQSRKSFDRLFFHYFYDVIIVIKTLNFCHRSERFSTKCCQMLNIYAKRFCGFDKLYDLCNYYYM